MQKLSKSILIIIAVILLLSILVTQIAPLTMFAFHYWDCLINKDTPVEPFQFYLPIERDLVLACFGARSSMSDIHSVPLFAYYQNLHWNVSAINNHLMSLNGEPLENTAITVGYSFVMQIEDYTIIAVGSHDIGNSSLSASDIYDSLGTKPLLVSSDLLRKNSDDRNWGCPSLIRTNYGRIWVYTNDLSDYSYCYIVKEMPNDYELHIGNQCFSASSWKSAASETYSET